MKAWLEINREGGKVEKRTLTPQGARAQGGENALAAGACPGCKAEPFFVRGGNPTALKDDRTIRSQGRAVCCGDAVGYLFVLTDTLFGLEEDYRMLRGRPRVY